MDLHAVTLDEHLRRHAIRDGRAVGNDRPIGVDLDAEGAHRRIHRGAHRDGWQNVDDIDLDVTRGSGGASTRRNRSEGDQARALLLSDHHVRQVLADDVSADDPQAQLRASKLRQGLPGLAVKGRDRNQYGRPLGDLAAIALHERRCLRAVDLQGSLDFDRRCGSDTAGDDDAFEEWQGRRLRADTRTVLLPGGGRRAECPPGDGRAHPDDYQRDEEAHEHGHARRTSRAFTHRGGALRGTFRASAARRIGIA